MYLTRAVTGAGSGQLASSRELKQASILYAQALDLLAAVVGLLNDVTQAHRMAFPDFRHRRATLLGGGRRLPRGVVEARRHLLEVTAALLPHRGRAHRVQAQKHAHDHDMNYRLGSHFLMNQRGKILKY